MCQKPGLFWGLSFLGAWWIIWLVNPLEFSNACTEKVPINAPRAPSSAWAWPCLQQEWVTSFHKHPKRSFPLGICTWEGPCVLCFMRNGPRDALIIKKYAHILAILAFIQMICYHCINGGYMWIYVWVHVIRMMYVHWNAKPCNGTNTYSLSEVLLVWLSSVWGAGWSLQHHDKANTHISYTLWV